MLTSTIHWTHHRDAKPYKLLLKGLRKFQRISILARYWGLGRRTVEQTRSLEIGFLQRNGYFTASKPGWLTWRCEGKITGIKSIEWDGIRLRIQNQLVDIGRTPCRFGGYRLWFRCSCGRHVSALYSPNWRPWACRHCYRLTYATRQAIPRDRQLLRAQRIRRRLGGSANMLEPFPPKPRGMHWRTYERLRRVHDLADEKAMLGWAQWLDRRERTPEALRGS
jgi:hypothetical protein